MFEHGARIPCLLLPLVLALGAPSLLAGPGGSGGNPSLMIASPARNYLFTAVAPTSQTFATDRDDYHFTLAGFDLTIVSVPYDTSRCAATNAVKTVCKQADGSTLVVFGDRSTFQLRFTDTGLGARRLEAVSAGIVATFSQGIMHSHTLGKD